MILALILASAVTITAAAGPPASTQALPQQESTAPDVQPPAPPEDSRTQYPPLLANAYVGIDLGSISYAFSSRQLEPGFEARAVRIPHAAAHLVIGHEFGKYLGAQIEYMRPVQWVNYEFVNGIPGPHTVWVAVGTFAGRGRVPITSRLAAYGEGGLAIVSRTGFKVDGAPAVANAHFPSPMAGGGIEYTLTPAWDLVGGATYVPANGGHEQPAIALGSVGIRYHLRPLPPERVAAARESGFVVPRHVVMAGLVTNGLGYGWNTLVSDTVPIFFGGHARIASGLAVRYQQNIFHTARRFAVDLGASASVLKTDLTRESVAAVSVYPVARWTFLTTGPADVFASYSLAGPSYLSRRVIDGFDTSSRFTFQDMLAFGVYAGRRRQYLVQVDISHFSNGNIFPGNPGVKVPLTITVGRGF